MSGAEDFNPDLGARDKTISLFQEYLKVSDDHDFEGAEEILAQLLELASGIEGKIHFEFGRLYIRWNKLTSAIQHLRLAAEKANDQKDFLLLAQINAELGSAKDRQKTQKP